MTSPYDIIVIGGGAAGFFAAITAAEARPGLRIALLERGGEVLGKVKVSGGGRCNVTHACWDPRELVKNYPRGSRELLGPFNKFAPGDTVEWFEKRGVATKIEDDGRMFPVTDSSQTIVDCLTESAYKAGVQVMTQSGVTDLLPPESPEGNWTVKTSFSEFQARQVMVATGSAVKVWDILARLGHSIVPPVPSLFTFPVPDHPMKDLAGLAVQDARIRVIPLKLSAEGPLLITHEGLSGPAVLRLSAWGARELNGAGYQFELGVNWLGKGTFRVADVRQAMAKKLVSNGPQGLLPARLWERLVAMAGIPAERRWSDLRQAEIQELEKLCSGTAFQVSGKSTHKEEFVTAGGVDLREIDFRTFGSKIHPGLYLAGEAINIDAITGGFNFQAAWTGGWVAGHAMATQAG